MSHTFSCPHCATQYVWKANLAGKQVRCKKCANPIAVPSAASPPVANLVPDELFKKAADTEPLIATLVPTPQPPQSPGRSITMDDTTSASNPGLLKVQWKKYLVCYKWEPLIWILCGVGVLLVIVFSGQQKTSIPVAVISIVSGLSVIVGWNLLQRKEHFWHGCTCPAVVISKNPYLIAAASDLSTGGGYFPAIKIMRQPLKNMTGGPPEIGTRLATVATYRGNVKSQHWTDFEPLAVNCATTDLDEIDRVFQSIPQDEWDMLDRGLTQIPTGVKSGKIFFIE